MKRVLPGFALLLAACGTTPTPVATGEFSAPSGLAATSAGDRDLLFIANEGHDNLSALQICSMPFLADGGVDTANDTCPTSENFQFLPAPIRVFPATIETADRPRRLAGVRLSRADTPSGKAGVILAVGDDDTLRVVDARNLLEAANHLQLADGGMVAARSVLTAHFPSLTSDAGPLSSPAADVVAENEIDGGVEVSAPAGQTVTAFAATVAEGTAPAQLLMFQVGLDATGAAAMPTLTGQCTLDPVLPRKLAVIPGGGDRVYVADGAGDGVVAVTKASIPAPSVTPAACTMTRIGAGGRPARSVAVSPAWWEGTTPHPAGEFLIMVLEPLSTVTPGAPLDPGGILIARTADGAVVPEPPASLFDQTPGLPAMQPIAPQSTLPREVAFLRVLPPDSSCVSSDGGVGVSPCTPIYVGYPTATPVAKFNLLAVATGTDGATYFVDVEKRRFVNSSYYLGDQSPTTLQAPLLSPSTSDPTPPTLTFVAATTDHPLGGWLTAGVTRAERWRVIWHAPFTGLETRSGSLSTTSTGTLLLQLPALDLAPWQSDPTLQLAPGDTVSFVSYTVPAGAPTSCSDMVAAESASRFDLPILSISSTPATSQNPVTTTLELPTLQPTATVRGFNLSACPTGLGVVATIRAAGTKPWLVIEGATTRGRAANGQPFVATGRRFDYPLDLTAPLLPSANVDVAFQIGGDNPVVLGTTFSFAINSGSTQLTFRDGTLTQGFATTVLSYASPRYQQLIFTSATGGNAVIQADPLQLSTVNGVVSYK